MSGSKFNRSQEQLFIIYNLEHKLKPRTEYFLYKRKLKNYIKSIKTKTIIFGYNFDCNQLNEWVSDDCIHVICDKFDTTFHSPKDIKYSHMKYPNSDIIRFCQKTLQEKPNIRISKIDSEAIFYCICAMYPSIPESDKFYADRKRIS